MKNPKEAHLTYLRFTPTENNRCWIVVAHGLEEIAQVKQLSPGLHAIIPNRPLSAEELRGIEVFMVYERRDRRRAKRRARSLEWLEALYLLEHPEGAAKHGYLPAHA